VDEDELRKREALLHWDASSLRYWAELQQRAEAAIQQSRRAHERADAARQRATAALNPANPDIAPVAARDTSWANRQWGISDQRVEAH
jgi:hypothetical protein